jgi:invasion protein IalB
MQRNMLRTMTVALIGATMAFGGAQAVAQAQHESVATQRDWFVFESGSDASRVCWIVSQPKSWVARRGNQTVQVNRGDVFLMVSARPAANVTGEVSMITGYTFREGSTVTVEIGDNRFEMFTDGDKAWSEDAAADARIVAAMRSGVEARLTGISSRGTTTIDTFSLLGFTAALDDAQGRCR